MSSLFATRSGFFTRLLTATALTGALVGVGCSDDDNDPGGGNPTPTTTMTGAFVGAGDGGRASVTVSTTTLAPGLPRTKIQPGAGGARILGTGSVATHNVFASGSFDLDAGGVVGLSGTYSDETDSLHLTGGGYTLLGAYDDTGGIAAITGAYNGPNGIGFFAVVNAPASSVTTFCGTFVNAGATLTGRLNLVVIGSDAGGAGFPDGDPEGVGFEGTVTGTGNPKTISLSGSTNDGPFTATGDWDTTTNTVTGTWEQKDGSDNVLDSGTWEADFCN
jgi:hypothetical protein